MKINYLCGYYSDLAHNGKQRRTEDYWDAYFYVWAVKTGLFKRKFFVHLASGVKRQITEASPKEPRVLFGRWLAQRMAEYGEDAILVPVPSKDALSNATSYRSLALLEDSVGDGPMQTRILDALRWKQPLSKAHTGGSRSRAALGPLLTVRAPVEKMRVVLSDDLVSTGGSMLACMDVLTAAGADVVGAIVCGRTVYEQSEPSFKTRSFDLTHELSDWPGH